MDAATDRRNSLKFLSADTIQEAFDRVESETNINNGKLVLITPMYYDQALQLMKDHFVHDEPMAIAFDMQWDDDAEMFWREVFNDNLSIGVCEENTGDLIAVRGIKVITDGNVPECMVDARVMDKRLEQGLAFMTFCDEQTKFFQHFKTDCAVHFLGLCVSSQHRNKGIASKVFEAALKLIANFKIPQVFVKGEGSSIFSQKIYDKFGFEKLYEIAFADYGKESNIALRDTGDHAKFIAYGKCVKSAAE